MNEIQLPVRVKNEIEVQRYKSELMVSGVQLAVIALLAIINFFTPSTYSPNASVDAASLGLSMFAILTLVQLWVVWTRQLTPYFLGFSIVAEMLLLLFIIWIYHLQYEITEVINLKNSHINYVYILIALRALRFEPKWVLVSGFTAFSGWIYLVWMALSSASMSVITWDYVTYASTSSLYLGAIFDVAFTILLVTLIIALVLSRAKKTLYKAVTETSAAEDLARFFDVGVAEKITKSELEIQAGYGEIRHAAILFTDMRNFTNVTKKLSPSQLILLLEEYHSLVVPIIQKHNGTIDKFIGDGIMASFGAVSPSKNYAADALRAVDEILAVITAWKETRRKAGDEVINIGIGVTAGEVLFGVVGNAQRLEYTVIGDSVNLAAKLEKHNKIEHSQALTTVDTLREAFNQNYVVQKKELKGRTVAGVEGPINLVVLG